MTNKPNTTIGIGELVPPALVPLFINAPIQFDVTDAGIAELRVKHKVKPVTNTRELKENAASIAVIRTLRVKVDKRRKELKKGANEYGKTVQTEANRITEELESIEKPLNDAKDAYEAKKAAVAAEKKRKEEERVQTIKNKINEIKIYPANFIASTIPQIKKAIELLLFAKDECDYQEFASEVLQVKTTAIDDLKQLQTKREDLDREAKEAEEKRIELAKQEAELKAEREKLAIERAEAEKKANDQRAEAIRLTKIEQDKLAIERKAIADAQAALQAEKDATKAKQEAAEKLVKEQAIKQTALQAEKTRIDESKIYMSLFNYYNDQLPSEQKEALKDISLSRVHYAAPIMLLALQQVVNAIEDRRDIDIDMLEKVISHVKEGGIK